jgi:hypothetical protein
MTAQRVADLIGARKVDEAVRRIRRRPAIRRLRLRGAPSFGLADLVGERQDFTPFLG